jgi:hypothetical protein
MPFEFFEVVRIEPRPDTPAEIRRLHARIGAVLGKSAEDGQEPTSYAVDLDDVEEAWTIDARDLVATGQFRKRGDYYDGTSIRVSVCGELIDWTEPS